MSQPEELPQSETPEPEGFAGVHGSAGLEELLAREEPGNLWRRSALRAAVQRGHAAPCRYCGAINGFHNHLCYRCSWPVGDTPNVRHHSRPDGGTKGCSAADVTKVGS